MACVASTIQSLPGINQVGMVPDTSPPVMIVLFDPAQTSAQDIAQQAKMGLESDSFVPTTFAVNFVTAEPDLLNVSALNPVRFFAETDLFVQDVQPSQLTLDNYLFGCGTCMDALLNQLPNLNGVAKVDRQAVPGGSPLVAVVRSTWNNSHRSSTGTAATTSEAHIERTTDESSVWPAPRITCL